MAEQKPERGQFDTDAEFDEAMASWLANPDNQTKSGEVKPQSTELKGVITSVTREIMKEVNGDKRYFRLVKVGDGEEILVSKTLFDSNAALLKEGNEVVLTAERRVAGKTGYKGADGKWTIHAGNGLSFTKGAYSTETATRKGAIEEKNTSRSALFSKATSQISDTIRQADGADKQAVAMALAGVVKFEI